jgi:hypothetical protein
MNRQWSLTDDFQFSYEVNNFDTIDTVDYLDAIDKASKLIREDYTKVNLSKVGLCLSGTDSELIARSFHKLNIPVEYFFLDIDGINSVELALCQKIAERYQTKLNVVSITKEDLLNNIIYENFDITYVLYPTYVTMPVLIKNIPDDFYIVAGEGDIEKGWPRYLLLYDEKVKEHDNNYFYIPAHLTEVSYRLTIDHYKKHGESNFYSRCFDTWYHLLKDDRLVTDGKCLYDPKEVILAQLSNELGLLSPLKTMNYEHQLSLRQEIKRRLFEYAKPLVGWKPEIGDIIKVPKALVYGIF